MELSKLIKLISAQQNEIKTNPKVLENHFKIEKTYIPLQLKRQIVKNIVNFSIYEDETTKMLMHDLTLQDLMTVLHIVIECTDIKIDNLFIEDEVQTDEVKDENTGKKLNLDIAVKSYDKLMQFGIYRYIEERLENNDINQLVDYEIKQILSTSNSVAHVVLKTMEKLISIIPSQDKIQDLITTLPQAVSQLDRLQFWNGLGNSGQVQSQNNISQVKEVLPIDSPIKVVKTPMFEPAILKPVEVIGTIEELGLNNDNVETYEKFEDDVVENKEIVEEVKEIKPKKKSTKKKK